MQLLARSEDFKENKYMTIIIKWWYFDIFLKGLERGLSMDQAYALVNRIDYLVDRSGLMFDEIIDFIDDYRFIIEMMDSDQVLTAISRIEYLADQSGISYNEMINYIEHYRYIIEMLDMGANKKTS